MSIPWNWEPLPHWEHRVLASSRTTHRRALRPPTRWQGRGHFSREFLMVHPSKKWLYRSDNSNMFVLEHNGVHFIIWYVFRFWGLRVQSRQVSLNKNGDLTLCWLWWRLMYQRAGLNVGSCGWNVKRTACASETWGLPVYQIVEAESNGSSSFDRTQFKSTQMKKISRLCKSKQLLF